MVCCARLHVPEYGEARVGLLSTVEQPHNAEEDHGRSG